MVQEVYCTQQSVIIISLDGLRISRAEHSLVKLAPKRGHGHWLSAAGLTQYSFFNPGETTASEKCVQRTNEVHPKLQYLGYHWQTERFQFSTSNYTPNNTSKAEKHWALKFCLSSMFLPTDYHSFRNLTSFLQGNTTINRNCFQEFLESWNMGFYTTEINWFLTGKNVLVVVFWFWLIRMCLSLVMTIMP